MINPTMTPNNAVLNSLEQSGLIRLIQLQPELEYLFRHALVQETAYDSILRADRRTLHHAVASEIEQLYPDRLDELSSMLAHHYREADDSGKALVYYQRAAKHAAQKFANQEAIYNLRAALQLCTDQSVQMDLRMSIGELLVDAGQLAQAEVEYLQVLPLLRQHNDLDRVARVHCQLAQIKWGQNNVAASLEVARQGLAEVEGLHPCENLAELLRYVSNGSLFNNLLEDAEQVNARALAMAESCNARNALSQALTTQGLIEDHHGRTDQAIACLKRAIAIAEADHNVFATSRAHNNLAYIYLRAGQHALAADQYERMITLNRKTNSIFGEIWFLAQKANLFLDLGQIAEVQSMVETMQTLLATTGGKTYRVQVTQVAMQTLVYLGRPDEVIPVLEKECEQVISHNDPQMTVIMSGTLGLAYLVKGDYAAAARALAIAEQYGGVWRRSVLFYQMAGYAARAGQLEQAYDALQKGDDLRDPTSYADTASRNYAMMQIRAAEADYPGAMQFAKELIELHHKYHHRWLFAMNSSEAADLACQAGDFENARYYYQQALDEYKAIQVPILADRVQERLNKTYEM